MLQTIDQNPSGDFQDRSATSAEKIKTKTGNTMSSLWCSHENRSNDDTGIALQYFAKLGLNRKSGSQGQV